MAIRTLDNLNGTPGVLVASRSGETGATWVQAVGFPANSGLVIDSTGARAKGGGNGGAQLFATGVATTTGEYAEATLDILSANPGFGVWIRTNPNLNGSSRGYMAYFNAGTVKILRQDNATTFVQVGGTAVACAVPVANGVLARITATDVGATVSLAVAFNGTTVFTGVDGTASRITALGGTGMYCEEAGSDTQYAHFTKIEMRDAAAEDTIAPVLSNPTGAASGSNSATGSVATDEGNGTLYCLTNTAATATSSAIIAGGTTQAVTSTGAKSFSIQGLSAATQYYNHFVHVDGASNVSNIANSAAFTTSAAQVVTSFAISQFADSVREGVSSASGTVIITTGAAPAQYRTFSSAFATGVRGIPVRVEEVDSGNWILCDVTLSASNQLSVTRIYASSTGFTMPAFGSGAKSAFCVLPASQIVRKDFIDLAAYGADSTFANDSTQAWQAAINDAYTLGISVIRASYGRYKIAGPLVQNVGGYNPNSQIYIPQTRESEPNKTIWIQGACPPNFEQQVLRDVPLPTNGVLLESTIVGTGTRPAVIGAVPGNTGDTAGWQFNYTNFGIDGVGIRTNVDAGANPMSGLNLWDCAQVMSLGRMSPVRIDINKGLLSSPNPVSVESAGVIMPKVNNHLLMNGGTLYVSGYTHGVIANEHTKLDNYTAIGCYNGLTFDDANHASQIGMFSVEGCVNDILIRGNHAANIGVVSSEHFGAGYWYQHQNDIKIAAASGVTINKALKISVTHYHIVQANVGVNYGDFTTNATTANYKILVGAGAN